MFLEEQGTDTIVTIELWKSFVREKNKKGNKNK